eukprot:TRINITY_DN1264_c0_g1_i1.p1 TRINITY_DN1264_c0_g1~~TRINITY_DN1264_c0_g1_i1.p1  ORF type:complete len:159 (-),score=22.18 TRINITY_DN1264_c0_g1_i1:87-563(-)
MKSFAVVALFALLFVVAVSGRALDPAHASEPQYPVEKDAPLNTCGGNCPSNDCPGCPCGDTRSTVSISSICSKYGWSQSCCECIVSHESGGDANAANYNSNGSYDIGVFQINSVNWNDCSGGKAPCDVTTNLNCAIQVWKWGGNSFKLWSTCGGCGCC